MKRSDAVKIIHEILEKDTYGFRDSMTDEQIEDGPERPGFTGVHDLWQLSAFC